MIWDNAMLVRLIQNKSNELSFLKTTKPHRLENNALIDDDVFINQVELRKKIDRIRGTDQSELVSDLIEAIELGSTVKAIEKDKYSEKDINEYLEYMNSYDIWQKINEGVDSTYLRGDNMLPQMCLIYSRERNQPILIMQTENYIRSIGLDESELITTDRYNDYSYNFHRMSYGDITDHLSNVDFDSLRLRLISSGFSQFVKDIDFELLDM